MIDFSLIEQSSRISCQNMRELATIEAQKNHYSLSTSMSRPSESHIFPSAEQQPDEVVEFEHNLMMGIQVHKKSCIYKRPEYNSGCWTNQFHKILPTELDNQYNIKTKAKDKQYKS